MPLVDRPKVYAALRALIAGALDSEEYGPGRVMDRLNDHERELVARLIAASFVDAARRQGQSRASIMEQVDGLLDDAVRAEVDRGLDEH